MIDAITSLFTLRWSQQPLFHPLPPTVSRSSISTPGGDLELLTCKPKVFDPSIPPIFFIHGGCGHASVWLEWMTYLQEAGYGGTLYSYSARNHGASHSVPYLRMVYGTSLDDMADDLVACVQAVREIMNGAEPVLVGHSSGGGLVQYVLAQGRVQCRALCLLDSVPHYGNFALYINWARHDPCFMLRSLFHLQHPNSPLSTTSLIHGAFFSARFPRSAVQEFVCWMPNYEAMGWPMGMGFWSWMKGRLQWLDAKDVLRGVETVKEGEEGKARYAVCVMIGSEDMMIDKNILGRQVDELRHGLRQLQEASAGPGKEQEVEADEGAATGSSSGVRLVVVQGAGHHLQNDLQRDIGAEALLSFARQC